MIAQIWLKMEFKW